MVRTAGRRGIPDWLGPSVHPSFRACSTSWVSIIMRAGFVNDPMIVLGAGPAGLLSIRRPDDRGVIRVWGWGTWSPEYVDAHFIEIGRII